MCFGPLLAERREAFHSAATFGDYELQPSIGTLSTPGTHPLRSDHRTAVRALCELSSPEIAVHP